MSRRGIALGTLVAIVVLAIAALWLVRRPTVRASLAGRPPLAGARELAPLGDAGPPLGEAFDAAALDVRLIVLLSPT